MSDQARRIHRGNDGAAERKGGQRTTETTDVRQQEIVHTIRQRQQSNFFRKFIHVLKSILGR